MFKLPCRLTATGVHLETK